MEAIYVLIMSRSSVNFYEWTYKTGYLDLSYQQSHLIPAIVKCFKIDLPTISVKFHSYLFRYVIYTARMNIRGAL